MTSRKVCLTIAWLVVCVNAIRSEAQVRGVYPLGMSATNSWVTPSPGFTYANAFLFYSRDELKGSPGETLGTGQQSVLMDLNSLVWVSKAEVAFLGGAVVSVSATLPIANNSLTSTVQGAINGGGGFADSYYQPIILGWRKKRNDLRAAFGFLAPTGKFKAGATDNVGSGYWTPVVSAGQTFYLTKNRSTAASAFEMYEFHTPQQGTKIHPGQTLDLDYSVTQAFAIGPDLRLQVGLVGYEQWQTTDKTGPMISTADEKSHYQVNALGFASNLVLPVRLVSVGIKYFTEFSNKFTFQGHSVQISASVSF